MLEKCVVTILELNWNRRLGHKKAKLNMCHHMLTSSMQLQNRSFHVVERTRTATKCQKKCTCKACKNSVYHCQIYKFVGFLLPSTSWLLKLFIKDVPLFLQASHSEKPSITTLTSTLAEKMVKKYDTVAISRTVS